MSEIEIVEYYPWTELEPHPCNMRRVYPRDAVEQMAQSIKANAERGGPGIIEPLLGCRVNPSTSPSTDPSTSSGQSSGRDSGHRGRIRIYAGNLRWHGAAYLGEEAPPVPVILRELDEAEQMLDMAVENKVRFDPDPLSEALHYKALLDAGLSKTRIARELGVSLPTITSRLAILDLPEEVHRLFAEGKLPRLASKPLLELGGPEVQIAAARFLVEQNASLATVRETCRRIAEQMRQASSVAEPTTEPEPGTEPEPDKPQRWGTEEWRALSDEMPTAPTPTLVAVSPMAPAPFQELDILVRATCAACELGRMIEGDVLWEDMRQAARSTCRACDVRGLQGVCGQCPLPDFLRRLRTVLEVRHDGE